ncbi:Tungstate uptake system permease protein TupB [Desulfarculales bacterium]
MDYILEGLAQALRLLFRGDPEIFSALWATFSSSSLAMLASLLLGLPLGFVLGHGRFRGSRLLCTLVDTCLALPTVLIGLVVYAFLSRRGPLGQWGLLFTLPGLAIGQAILALPVVVALTASVVEGLDRRLRPTLLTLGASRRQVVLTTLWEARQGLLAAAINAYSRVVTEVGIAMMVGGNIKWHTRTVTTAIALETGKGEFAQGIALGLILLAMALLVNLSLIRLRRGATP